MKMRSGVVSIVLVASMVGGCATSPNKIRASYVSPMKYESYDRDQIVTEMDHISRRTTELYHSLKKDAKNDKWQMGVGLLLFWPTLFLLEGGDGPEAAEYAQLKGEYEALRQVAVQKKYDLVGLPPSPEEVIKQQDKAAENKEQRAESKTSDKEDQS